MYKAIVFGGAGFIGSHVADELSKREIEVIIFDKIESNYIQKNQKMIIGNILDRELVRKSIRDCDYVFHFAAIADIKEARDNPIETANFNIIGTLNILDACREFNIKRFIYSSTIYVYSNHGSFYRTSKQSCELFIENYQKEYNLNYTVLRYGSLYGSRANQFNFIHNSIKEAITTGEINRKGDGEEIRDYINVKDAAKSSVDALNNEYKNSYLMITGNQTMKVKELLSMIKEIFNNSININYTKDTLEGHYKITPFSFNPKVAIKINSNHYHDLGQGILETIYEIYDELKKNEI